MNASFIRTVILAFLAVPGSLAAEVEVVAGAPVTQAVNEPFSIDFDKRGNLYGVEFTKSNRVFKLADRRLEFIAGVDYDTGKDRKTAGLNDGSDPLKAAFNGMHDIQVTADDRLVLADSFHHVVRMMNLETGAVSTLAGTGKPAFSGDGGPAKEAGFNITMTATLSPDGKSFYVADIGNHRVREIDGASGRVRTVAGNGSKGNPADGADALETPMGDARAVTQAEDGTLYVILRGGNSLVAVKDGKVRTVVNAGGRKGYGGDGGNGREALLNGPKYVAMDREGNVLICDTENHCVRRFSPETGKIELLAGTPGKAGTGLGSSYLKTELRRPHGVRLAPDGTLYIADTYNNRVLRGDYR